MVRLSLAEAAELCERAAMASGASQSVARSLARSSVAAEAGGQPSLGLSHFVDYLDALRSGRIDGQAEPAITRPAPAVILSDARGGAAHPGFDLAFDEFVLAARSFGIAVFSQKNAYTCGALGYFVARLAEAGLAAIAATNGPALLAGAGSKRPVYCTNPMAFAAPVAEGPPLVIDQSSSATAFVNIRKAAKSGQPIPQGWAIDADGHPTTDAGQAMKGALLAFGGARGANIALMVEVLAAGLSGANWSLDAPSFNAGAKNPGTGLFVIALSPALLAPGFEKRMKSQVERLSGDFGVHIPGRKRAAAKALAITAGVDVPESVWKQIGAASD